MSEILELQNLSVNEPEGSELAGWSTISNHCNDTKPTLAVL
ncbi:class III lanthipeptide [Streptomyces sp. RKAG293]|nr:class III lanthipeptide [Streptomyces sp. RKAG293]MCM2424099.1 class III lanthipeptide [Streptomyces sp. RKAG293]